MVNWFINTSVYIQVLFASLFTFLITALGSSLVFFFKKVNNNILDAMLGASAGIMVSASFWSLLNPAIEGANELGMISYLVVTTGFLLGGIFLIIGDILFSKFLNKKNIANASGIKRSFMLIFSITLHNIPEGLAVGVAFGSLAYHFSNNTLLGAIMLAVGIGIQNFPEGTAVSLPLRREKYSRFKSFVYGALSGAVEPIAAFFGCWLIIYIRSIMPFLLSFAAGAMIYVTISELIPESQKNRNKNLMSLFTLLGFAIMMLLDVALG